MRHPKWPAACSFEPAMKLAKKFAFFRSLELRTRSALLLLCLELCLVIPNCTVDKVDRGAKSTDAYWTETGLSSRELEALLAPSNCLKDHRNFLGCVNTISAMGERYRLTLNRDGRLVAMTADLLESRLTERRELTDWEKSLSSEELSPEFSFVELWKELDRRYVKSSERAAVIAAGINAYLSVTKDPHSYIVPLAFYEEVLARSDSRPLHLGFVSKRVKGGAYVRKVFEGSPAATAGLRKGDRILEVNGQSVTSLHPVQYSEMLKIQDGDRIRLRIERREHGKISPLYVELLKSDSIYPNVIARMLEGSKPVGLITVHKFARETCVNVRQQVISLMEEGAAGLILDLRDNPGGQVDEAACLLNLFVAKDKLLFETRYLDMTRPSEPYIARFEPIFSGPLTVLINGGSASASEIVAGSLKDLGRATLVGERSFGKGSFQDGHLWAANSRVALFETEGLYYFPSGWTPQMVGLDPDIKITSLEDESLRESDLYYNPVRPGDLWTGPQSLAWIEDSPCGATPFLAIDDPQIERAASFMTCSSRSMSHDRHGTL